ncbi:MAG: hypothetical protein ABIR04_05160 [Cypionkella sp.]
MRLLLSLISLMLPIAAFAESFQRPIPQPQTAEAELSYLVAAVFLLLALIGVQWLVSRR